MDNSAIRPRRVLFFTLWMSSQFINQSAGLENEGIPQSAARFGLSCTYSDWANEPGIFYTCTCSYHGWSCIKGYYV